MSKKLKKALGYLIIGTVAAVYGAAIAAGLVLHGFTVISALLMVAAIYVLAFTLTQLISFAIDLTL